MSTISNRPAPSSSRPAPSVGAHESKPLHKPAQSGQHTGPGDVSKPAQHQPAKPVDQFGPANRLPGSKDIEPGGKGNGKFHNDHGPSLPPGLDNKPSVPGQGIGGGNVKPPVNGHGPLLPPGLDNKPSVPGQGIGGGNVKPPVNGHGPLLPSGFDTKPAHPGLGLDKPGNGSEIRPQPFKPEPLENLQELSSQIKDLAA